MSRGMCQHEGCERTAGAAGRHCDEHYEYPGPLPQPWPQDAAKQIAENIAKRIEQREGVKDGD